MDEFDYISHHLSPLSIPGALNNDAFIYQGNTVITKDLIIEGVHFLKDTTACDIAKKAIRVNLSDIAAMGAKPYGYFLGLAISNTIQDWLESFTAGLKEENERYQLKLLGGDTAAHQGANIVSITMLGLIKEGKALTRSGAIIGERVYVSGTIGDAAIGLATYNNIEINHFIDLQEKYKLPEPQIKLGQYLSGNNIASACIDISDGLVQDANHICTESHVGMDLYLDNIPFSSSVEKIFSINENYLEQAITGGDDYQLLFTSPHKIEQENITEIGTVTAGNKVILKDNQGHEFKVLNNGYKHFG